MKKLEYQVSFTTPAFLGNVDQQAQWRTPPFKALLRQWWRVVHAPKVKFNVDALRQYEGQIFGIAADGGDSRQSLVRLWLSRWDSGKVDKWDRDDRLPHPEVTNRQDQIMQVGAQLYLGYGPLAFGETGRKDQQGRSIKDTVLNQDIKRTAIADNASQTLTVMVPESHQQELGRAIELCAWFGAVGSRARNGWGTLRIVAKEGTPSIPEMTTDGLTGLLRPFDQCLDLDWPHAIGSVNSRPLVWTTDLKDSWREVMKDLARIKIEFRTQPALSLSGVA